MQKRTNLILVIIVIMFITSCTSSEQTGVPKFSSFNPEVERQIMNCTKYLEKDTKSSQIYALFMINNPGFLEVNIFPIEYYSEICAWKPDFYTQIDGKYFVICSGFINLQEDVNYNQYFAAFRRLFGKNLISDTDNGGCQEVAAPIIDRKTIKLTLSGKEPIIDTVDIWGLAPILVDSTIFLKN